MRIAGLTLAIIALSVSAASASPTPKPACLKTASSQTAMNQCAGRWLSNAQARLSKTLTLARLKLGRKPVDASETAWIAYRNAECRLQAARYAGGSIYPLVYLTCEERLTDTRTAQVQSDIANVSH